MRSVAEGCKLGICIHVIDQYKTCWILLLWKFAKTTPSKTTGEIFFRFSFGSHTLCKKKKFDWCVNFTTPENKYNILALKTNERACRRKPKIYCILLRSNEVLLDHGGIHSDNFSRVIREVYCQER